MLAMLLGIPGCSLLVFGSSFCFANTFLSADRQALIRSMDEQNPGQPHL